MENSLSVCIIAKDNEKTIGNAISSVISIAGEIILVDTGSKDKTKDIANSLGCKVYDFQWNDNFSDAKNFAISKATGNWILNLDSDESISERDANKIKQTIEKRNQFLGYYLIQRNYSNALGDFGWVSSKEDSYEESKIAKGYTPRKMVRLFRNVKEIRFEGAVHESVIQSIDRIGQGLIADTDIVIHHYGSIEGIDKKAEKYVEIAKKNLENDYFQEYQIASQLYSIGKINDALEHLANSIKLNENFYASLLLLGIISIRKGKVIEAKPALIRALHLKQDEMIWEHLGIIETYENNFDKAIACFNKAIEMNPRNADFYYNLGNTLKLAGRINQAKQAYAKAVYLNPDYEGKIQ